MKYVILKIMNNVIDFITKYAFIFVWIWIVLFNIWEKQSKKLYKYEQRLLDNTNNSIKSNNVESKCFISKISVKKVKAIKIIVFMLYIVFSICSICSLIAYGFKCIIFKKLIYPTISILLTTVLTELLIMLVDKIGKYKTVFRAIYISLYLVLYCLWAYNKTFFIDILVVFITIILYFAFKKSKYKYAVLIVLSGINIIILSKSFNHDKLFVIYNILFSLGTGLIVTEIGNCFVIIEKEKKKISEREIALEDIKYIIYELMEGIFLTFNPLLCHQYDNFNVIKYEQFKKDLIQYLDKDNNECNLICKIQEYIITNIEQLEEYTKNFLKKEKYFILNKIFVRDEIDIIHDMNEIAHNMLIQYKTNNEHGLKVLLKRLIKLYDEVSYVIPEIEDLINQFGKDKIYVEYEIGTLRQVWPNGNRVKANEIYIPKSKRKNK